MAGEAATSVRSILERNKAPNALFFFSLPEFRDSSRSSLSGSELACTVSARWRTDSFDVHNSDMQFVVSDAV